MWFASGPTYVSNSTVLRSFCDKALNNPEHAVCHTKYTTFSNPIISNYTTIQLQFDGGGTFYRFFFLSKALGLLKKNHVCFHGSKPRQHCTHSCLACEGGRATTLLCACLQLSIHTFIKQKYVERERCPVVSVCQRFMLPTTTRVPILDPKLVE